MGSRHLITLVLPASPRIAATATHAMLLSLHAQAPLAQGPQRVHVPLPCQIFIAAPPPPPPPAAFTVGTMLPASSLEGLQRQLDQLPNHCPADGPCGGKCCCSAGLGPKHTQQAALLAADGAVLDFVGQDWKQLPASTTH